MEEKIIWHSIAAEGLPEKSGCYLVTVCTGVTEHKRLDLNCQRCVDNWKRIYWSWAETPQGWVPGVHD